MKNFFPVQEPRQGIYLTCVDKNDCRDTDFVTGEQLTRPIIYGTSVHPPGFQSHNSTTCPIPRVNTFQTLEDFYNQDFLQTFTDCLDASDFSTSASALMGFSRTGYFSGTSAVPQSNTLFQRNVSTPLLQGTSQEIFPHSCCLHPSFYIASVRGKEKSTEYYNPLFTTVHDFNCFAKDGCISGGSIKNVSNRSSLTVVLENGPNFVADTFDFPKASPRSVMWYLQNSIATVNSQNTGGTNEEFWLGNVVGTPGPLQTNNSTLYKIVGKALGSSDAPTQKSLVSYGKFVCPSTQGDPGPNTSLYTDSLLYPAPFSFNAKLIESNTYDVDCCTRGLANGYEGGSSAEAFITGLDAFLTETTLHNVNIDAPIPPPTNSNCLNYHCFESPFCQTLLNAACESYHPFDYRSVYAGACIRWRNWASTKYQPLQSPLKPQNISYPSPPLSLRQVPNTSNPPTFDQNAYPQGSYNSGVDLSVDSLISSCVPVLDPTSQTPWPAEILDQCKGLIKNGTNGITNFPRIIGLTGEADTPQYTRAPIQPYIINSANNQIDIVLTYTKYVYYGDDGTINKFVGRGTNAGTRYADDELLYASGGGVFGIVPQIENVYSLTTIYLDNIVAGTPESFYNAVSANFNFKLSQLGINGGWSKIPTNDAITFTFPQPNDAGGTFKNFDSKNFVYPLQNVTPARVDHSKNFITWTSPIGGNPGQLRVVQTLTNINSNLPAEFNENTPITEETEYINWVHRTENLSYLYNAASTTIYWNSTIDFVPDGGTAFNARCCYCCGS